MRLHFGIMANASLFFELDVTIFGQDGGVLSLHYQAWLPIRL